MTSRKPTDDMTSQRLRYRLPVEADLDNVSVLFSDARSNGLLRAPKSRRQSWLTMAINAGSWKTNGFGLFSIIEISSDTWVGLGGAWRPLGWPTVEITTSILLGQRERGFGTEATVRLLDWAFDDLALTEVDFLLHPENSAGLALASKLGAFMASPPTHPILAPPIVRRRRTKNGWSEDRLNITKFSPEPQK